MFIHIEYMPPCAKPKNAHTYTCFITNSPIAIQGSVQPPFSPSCVNDRCVLVTSQCLCCIVDKSPSPAKEPHYTLPLPHIAPHIFECPPLPCQEKLTALCQHAPQQLHTTHT
eukprot:GEMP01083026.1.p1 GENE.GEMP01083026.1~~GEMP01083026.1.p1  ORF type:complete len:112 (-),score=0.31 GEMP01083026.1:647-982(-)